MSDNESASPVSAKKRGRPAAAGKKPEVVEKKSKSAAPVKAAESNGVSPAKRGRGRPKKGTSKAATKKATPTKSGRGRGRPPAKSAAKKKSESEGEGSDDAADEAEEAGSD